MKLPESRNGLTSPSREGKRERDLQTAGGGETEARRPPRRRRQLIRTGSSGQDGRRTDSAAEAEPKKPPRHAGDQRRQQGVPVRTRGWGWTGRGWEEQEGGQDKGRVQCREHEVKEAQHMGGLLPRGFFSVSTRRRRAVGVCSAGIGDESLTEFLPPSVFCTLVVVTTRDSDSN
jgi:hypothetical protein